MKSVRIPSRFRSCAAGLLLVVFSSTMLTGCLASIGSSERRGYGAIVRGGLKSTSDVPPNCAQFASGRMTVSECFNDPNCRPCTLLAVRDLPPAGAR